MKNSLVPAALASYCVIIFYLSPIGNCYAQFDSLGTKIPWRDGSIKLLDNSSRKGLIQFNDKLGVVKFKEGQNDVEESFVETSIASMRFYDADGGRWRNFGTFTINVVEQSWSGSLLFEVLIEFENFALLSRIERVNIAMRRRTDYYGVTQIKKVGYEQFENFYLVNIDGDAEVVLAVNEFERDKMSLGSKQSPYLNKKALEKYLKNDWEEFQTIVKNNKLNLKNREDFLMAFNLFRQTKK